MAKIFPKSNNSNKKRDNHRTMNGSIHDGDEDEESSASKFLLLWQALRSSHNSGSSTVIATSDSSNTTLWYLLKAGICFSLGFYTTNLAFCTASSPAFVETVKAAEPITSAVLAVAWGIDTITTLEMTGLAGIITGVLLSTTASSCSHHSGNTDHNGTACSMQCCHDIQPVLFLAGIVSKTRRATAPGSFSSTKSTATSTTALLPPPPTHDPIKKEPSLTTQQQTQAPQLDDLNLQFRMQQTGVFMLIIPTLLWNGSSLLTYALRVATILSTKQFVGVMVKYFFLATVNGLAFSSYNLASTYILTRVAVIHHAALNCTRCIFAIVCTSIIFMTPISYLKALGITVSFLSFMLFTYAKTTKNTTGSSLTMKIKLGSNINGKDGMVRRTKM